MSITRSHVAMLLQKLIDRAASDLYHEITETETWTGPAKSSKRKKTHHEKGYEQGRMRGAVLMIMELAQEEIYTATADEVERTIWKRAVQLEATPYRGIGPFEVKQAGRVYAFVYGEES